MLHPQARALIDLMIERQVPPTHTLTPAEARRFYLERRGYTQPPAPTLAEVRDLAAPGPAGDIPLRLYKPFGPAGGAAAAALPVLVYFHGGGWVIGDRDTHDVLCRQLAQGSGCAVVSVDYRLAPEHRYPAAVDDCIAATRWVAREGAALGLDPARLAVGGDSAGGNLAAIVCQQLRDEAQRASKSTNAADAAIPLGIRFQLLIYPATDLRCMAESHRRNGQGYLLTQDSIAYYTGHYLNGADPADPMASPLLHSDFTGLPPALVLTAGFDPLVDEGIAYADRLSAAGVRCTQIGFERQVHGFITMGRVLDEANTAVAICADALRRELAG